MSSFVSGIEKLRNWMSLQFSGMGEAARRRERAEMKWFQGEWKEGLRGGCCLT